AVQQAIAASGATPDQALAALSIARSNLTTSGALTSTGSAALGAVSTQVASLSTSGGAAPASGGSSGGGAPVPPPASSGGGGGGSDYRPTT
ncbi:MAG: hypothetical protein EBR82_38895, partial [Caulobacteraceae bacterium]|nr:hypothetical protein [Caulobacteraceae bacterium]